MEVKKLRIDENGNLEIGGVNAKGRTETTFIAIPFNEGPSRLDIITLKQLNPNYNYGCENDVIVIRVGRISYENEIIWAPTNVVVFDHTDYTKHSWDLF